MQEPIAAVEESVQQPVRLRGRVATITGSRSLLSGALVVRGGDVLAALAVIAIAGLDPVAALFCLCSLLVLSFAAPPTLSGDVGDELGRLLASVAAPTLLFLPAAVRVSGLEALATTVPLLAGAFLAERAIAYGIVRRLRARGSLVEKTLIVGEGEVAASIIDVLQEHPEFGLLTVGSLGTGWGDLQIPTLGEVDDIEEVVRVYGVRRVIIAFGTTREPAVVRAVRACDDLPVEVYVVPRLFELGSAPAGRNVERMWGISLVRLPRLAHSRAARAVKRALDVAVAATVLTVLAPVLLLAAVAVKLSSPGPILFRQKRVGRHGRIFEILKFRTMRVHHDADTAWFVSDDDLITRVGRILRRTSLDEIPQLINVLRGEMSLVGPRPERPHYVDSFSMEIPSYPFRHRVAGGITGWAQIHGRDRSMDAIPERARFDNDYIETWSPWRDLLILARTLPQVFRGDAASQGEDPVADRST